MIEALKLLDLVNIYAGSSKLIKNPAVCYFFIHYHVIKNIKYVLLVFDMFKSFVFLNS